MELVHKDINGGAEFLPFAMAKIRALRATGLQHASQSFLIGDVDVRVRIEGQHSYVRIQAGGGGYVCLPHSTSRPGGVTVNAEGESVDPHAKVTVKKGTPPEKSSVKIKEHVKTKAGTFDWVGGDKERPEIISANLLCDRYGWAASPTPVDTYFFNGSSVKIAGAKIVGFGILRDKSSGVRKFIYAQYESDTEVSFWVTTLGSREKGTNIGFVSVGSKERLPGTWIFSRDGKKVESVFTAKSDVNIDTTPYRGVVHRVRVRGNVTITVPPAGAPTIAIAFTKDTVPSNTLSGGVTDTSTHGERGGALYTWTEPGPYPWPDYPPVKLEYSEANHYTNILKTVTYKVNVGRDFDADDAEQTVSAEFTHTELSRGPWVTMYFKSNRGFDADTWVSTGTSSRGATHVYTDAVKIIAGGAEYTSKAARTQIFPSDPRFTGWDAEGQATHTYDETPIQNIHTGKFASIFHLDGRDSSIACLEISQSPVHQVGDRFAFEKTTYSVKVLCKGGTMKVEETYPCGETTGVGGMAPEHFSTEHRVSDNIAMYSFITNGLGGSLFKSREFGKEFLLSFASKDFEFYLPAVVNGAPAELATPQGLTVFWREPDPPAKISAAGERGFSKFTLKAEPGFAINPLTIF